MFKKKIKFLQSKDLNFFCIGHSHLVAIQTEYSSNRNSYNKKNIFFNFIMLLDSRFKNYRHYLSRNKYFQLWWSFKIFFLVKLFTLRTNCIITSFGGNAHNIFGLVNLPEKFDFFLPQQKNSLVKGARIIPLDIVESCLKNQGGFPETIWCLRAIRKIYKGRIIQIESPPPIPNNKHLLKYAGPFKAQFNKFGPAPIQLRYKLWLIASALIKEECEKLNIEYIEAPKEMVDKNGYLKKKAWNLDTNHANLFYGKALINQIISLNSKYNS